MEKVIEEKRTKYYNKLSDKVFLWFRRIVMLISIVYLLIAYLYMGLYVVIILFDVIGFILTSFSILLFMGLIFDKNVENLHSFIISEIIYYTLVFFGPWVWFYSQNEFLIKNWILNFFMVLLVGLLFLGILKGRKESILKVFAVTWIVLLTVIFWYSSGQKSIFHHNDKIIIDYMGY